MTLEDKINEVLQVGIPLLKTEAVSRQYVLHPEDYKNVAEFALLLRQELALNEDALKQVSSELIKLSPAALKQIMDTRQTEYETLVSEVMAKNYKDIVKEADENLLLKMALGVSGKSRKYQDITYYLQEGETEKVRNEYASTFKEKSWQDFISNKASESFVKKFAEAYFRLDETLFAKEFTEEKEMDGKKVAVLNKDKIKVYINGKLLEANDEKAKAKFYLEAGRGIASYYQKLQAALEAERKK